MDRNCTDVLTEKIDEGGRRDVASPAHKQIRVTNRNTVYIRIVNINSEKKNAFEVCN